ncbi:hypothetical protein BJY00DRAFT_317669 [Aspergillus carlsbadensis]|nr:hypothetical protein BJY00DRAFT_317669 [Aspergillus carlsbadensis]
MARTVVRLELRPAPGSRPTDIFNKILQLRAKIPCEQRLHSEIGNSDIPVEQIDEDTVVLQKKGFADALSPDSDPPLEYYTDEDHMCNRDSGTDEHRVWKTTRVGGSEDGRRSIGDFGSRRIYLAAPYHPLIFQWAFQLLPGPRFIHSKDVKTTLAHKLWPKLDEEGLDEIVSKCWDYRFGDADEVKRDLGKFLVGKG